MIILVDVAKSVAPAVHIQRPQCRIMLSDWHFLMPVKVFQIPLSLPRIMLLDWHFRIPVEVFQIPPIPVEGFERPALLSFLVLHKETDPQLQVAPRCGRASQTILNPWRVVL